MKNPTSLPADLLMSPVQFMKGIGPARAEALTRAGVETVRDLLYYVPRRYLDKSSVVTIAGLRELTLGRGTTEQAPDVTEPAVPVRRFYTVLAEVRSFRTIGFRAKARFVAVVGDSSGSMQCVWFGGVHYWKNRFRVGEYIAVSGEPTYYGNILQFIHPDIDRLAGPAQEGDGDRQVDWNKMLHTGGLVPVYPSSSDLQRRGLDSAGLRRLIGNVLSSALAAVEETLPPVILRARSLEPLRDAFQHTHFPRTHEELASGLARLKYEELFQFQLMLALQRRRLAEQSKGITFTIKSALARRMVDSLPFKLTAAQVRVINEITTDMASTKPMHRLLQGDVGSGKTVVALSAILIAVDNGYQAAFMAPTEILAEQHFRTLRSFLDGIDVNVRLLTGGQRSKLRRDVLEDVRRGSANIVVGTHALFEGEVEFSRLGFVVIDEQHRFGVMQKASLRAKGESPDVLVMTATPIPRTLSLTLYGDLDVSIIDELPRNRKPVQTILKYDREKVWVHDFIRRQVREGRQAYFVYPLIEESEKLDIKAATVHFEHLQKEVYRDLRLGLLHGRLSSDEKDGIMKRFKEGQIDILVATTVIEVGIDVSNATVMVIENAERFGLSQLHQLRGRVGRGAEQSYCILLSARRQSMPRVQLSFPTEEDQQAAAAEYRLATMVSTNDGFRIAEVDLQLRGPGDFFGTRQSGVPAFRVANIVTDARVLELARADAFDIVDRDPDLHLPEHRPLAREVARRIEQASTLITTA
jgi:ATP-dependent DNA helicase RecG